MSEIHPEMDKQQPIRFGSESEFLLTSHVIETSKSDGRAIGMSLFFVDTTTHRQLGLTIEADDLGGEPSPGYFTVPRIDPSTLLQVLELPSYVLYELAVDIESQDNAA